MNHRRTRQSKRKTILGLIIAVVAVIIFGAVMYAVDVHSRQSEGKGDSGKWTAGLLDGTTLTLDDKNYVYTDDADIYLEALRCPGLTERIYARYRVILANPAFLTALVSSCCDGTELCRAERLTAEAQKQLTDLRAEQRAGR